MQKLLFSKVGIPVVTSLSNDDYRRFFRFRINNVIRVFVVEYLRQVIIVKIFVVESWNWSTKDYQNIFWENTCDRPKRTLRICVLEYRDRLTLSEYLL